MSVAVLTAVADPAWEARLVTALDSPGLGVAVVRRCVDLPDLLATAATGQARAVLVSADLRRLDRTALSRLAAAGVAVVGLFAPGDEKSEVRLRQLGLHHVLSADADPDVLSGALREAVSGLGDGGSLSFSEPRRSLVDSVIPAQPGPPRPGGGQVVAVWGPTGAPGRTTVAVGVASELAGLGRSCLLVDADTYGGVVAQVLGILDEAPGLAAAARLANAGTLDLAGLAGLARGIDERFRVLTGIVRADRWPELRAAAVTQVLDLARSLTDVTVVDCGFSLEQDEELVYDTAAPRRNGATLAALAAADTVLAVGTADPVGLQRLLRGLADLKVVLPEAEPLVVVNRLRPTGVPGDPAREVRTALRRYGGITDVLLLPLDVASLDAAASGGRTLAEVAPTSAVRRALVALARAVVGEPAAPAHRRRLMGRGTGPARLRGAREPSG